MNPPAKPSAPKTTVRASQFGVIGRKAERADQCTMVIFGATGDLTKRKLFPALYSARRRASARAGLRGAGRRARLRGDGPDVPREDAGSRQRVGRSEACGRGDLGLAGAADLLLRRRSDGRVGVRSDQGASRGDRSLASGGRAQSLLLSRRSAERVRADRAAPRRAAAWCRATTIRRPGRGRASSSRSRSATASRRRSAECAGAVVLRRASGLSHRSLPREGDGAERPRAALRQLDLRAAVEPAVDFARADHRGGDRWAWKRAASTTRKRASCATCSRIT